MAANRIGGVLEQLRKVAAKGERGKMRDEELLARFVSTHEAAAFELLIARHGPMVLNVCRRVLHDSQLAEDAFQATFLVLIRKAGSIGRRELLANWLYGVAYRAASRAKVDTAKRRDREIMAVPKQETDPLAEITARELFAVLDEQLSTLPSKYRGPLVSCYLEGKTRDEAAQQFGWSLATLARRLERGRDLLRKRLVRRGLGLPMALLPVMLSQATAAALPSVLLESTIKAAVATFGGQTAANLVSTNVAALTEGVLTTMLVSKLKFIAAVVLVVGLLGVGVGAKVVALARPAAQSQIAQDNDNAPFRANQPNALPDAKRILGTWKIVSVEVNGKESRDSPVVKQGQFTFTVDQLIVKGPNGLDPTKTESKNTYKLDATRKPKQLDMIGVTDGKAHVSSAIYSFDGDTLKICDAGPDGPRPSEFGTNPGSNLVLWVLQREIPAEQAPRAVADSVRDKDALQGLWRAVELEREGQKAPPEVVLQFFIRIKGDKLAFNPGTENREHTIKIDTKANPKALDAYPLDGPAAGQKLPYAIYELDGDQLKICLDGKNGKRPTEFKTKAGDGLALLTLKRVKEEPEKVAPHEKNNADNNGKEVPSTPQQSKQKGSPESETQRLRRAHLELLGYLPTPNEVKTFIDDDYPLKFEKTMGRLVAQRIMEGGTDFDHKKLKALTRLVNIESEESFKAVIRAAVEFSKGQVELASRKLQHSKDDKSMRDALDELERAVRAIKVLAPPKEKLVPPPSKEASPPIDFQTRIEQYERAFRIQTEVGAGRLTKEKRLDP